MLTLIVAATILPQGMAVKVAGLDIRQTENACWHDPKSGYFAFWTNACDGSHRSIVLTKDRRLVGVSFDTTRFGRHSDHGWAIEERAFPLATEDGVRIGMSPSQVRAKMGKPWKTAVHGAKREYWCALYKKVQMVSKKEGTVLTNTLIFKNSKLIEIIVNLNSVNSFCGFDSPLDIDWPDMKF